MSSWANRSVSLTKPQEPPRYPFFSPSEDFPASLLGCLYWSLYHQRVADPFYIYDPRGDLQPILNGTPTHRFLKEPSTGSHLSIAAGETASLLSSLSLVPLKRMVASTFVYSSQTTFQINQFLASAGLLKQSFDIGILLDTSGSVPKVIQSVKSLQKRLGKKTLSLFLATDNPVLLQDFVQKGDPSWTFRTLIRPNGSRVYETSRLKTLAEIDILRTIGALVLSYTSPMGKLLFLTNQATPSQFVAWDGSSWKPFE